MQTFRFFHIKTFVELILNLFVKSVKLDRKTKFIFLEVWHQTLYVDI